MSDDPGGGDPSGVRPTPARREYNLRTPRKVTFSRLGDLLSPDSSPESEKSEKPIKQSRRKPAQGRMCGCCKERVVGHDARTCPKRREQNFIASKRDISSNADNIFPRSLAYILDPEQISQEPLQNIRSDQKGQFLENSSSRRDEIPSEGWKHIENLHDFTGFFQQNLQITNFVPFSVQREFRHASLITLQVAEKDLSAERREQAWKLFLLLPAMLLRHTKQSGKAGRSERKRRFADFWSGRWDKLLEYSHKAWLQKSVSEENVFNNVIKHAQQGNLSRAFQLLQPQKHAPDSAVTIQKLKDLHPSPKGPSLHKPTTGPFEFKEISDEHLIEAIVSAKKKSAPGVTGWSFELLRFLLPQAGGSIQPLRWFAHSLLTNSAPSSVVEVLRVARLKALEKDDGNVRPIAIGDTLRRWVTRAICLSYKADWEKTLGVHQFAVGNKSGGEKMIRFIESFLQEDNSHTIVALDASNAFNTANRQKMMDELAIHYPMLLPFFWNWYGYPAPLWYFRENGLPFTIMSLEGIQQGDPAGPFLFSLGLRPTLLNIQSQQPEGLVAAYLDDISLGAPIDKIGEFTTVAVKLLGEYGLNMNFDKSKAWSTDWPDLPTDPPDIANLPTKIKRPKDGLMILGYPIGSSDFIRDKLDVILTDIEKGLEALTQLPNTQIALLLLRKCASVRAHYLARLLPLSNEVFRQAAERHDVAVQECACQVLGISKLSKSQHLQLSLPLRLGGFGLSALQIIGDAALYGSGGVTIPDVARREGIRLGLLHEEPRERRDEWRDERSGELIESVRLDDGDDGDDDDVTEPVVPSSLKELISNLPWVHNINVAYNSLCTHNELIDDENERSELPSVDSFFLSSFPHLQKKASDMIYSHITQDIHHNAPDIKPSDCARLLSCSGPGASGWLQAIPSCPDLQLSNADFKTATRLRVGLDFPSNHLSYMNSCFVCVLNIVCLYETFILHICSHGTTYSTIGGRLNTGRHLWHLLSIRKT